MILHSNLQPCRTDPKLTHFYNLNNTYYKIKIDNQVFMKTFI